MTAVDQLRGALRRAGVDALWISHPANVRAVTGFRAGQDGKVLLGPDGATLYTDGRYEVQAAEEASVPQFIARPPDTYQHAAAAVRGLRVGFEAAHLTVAALDDLRSSWPDARLVPLHGLVEGLRVRKSAPELDALRRAQAIADAALAQVLPGVQPGVRELDIALELELAMRRAGARSAFEIIVASGPNGARPHGVASERRIGNDELVTIDLGARVGGYHSDMTRTVAVGDPPENLRRLYRAVLAAEEAALAAVRPGVRAADLDALAREVLERHGLGRYFAHSLGHGVGLEIHEAPSLRAASEDVLEEGMVVTIEPGVYVPGEGGVRIEDLVLVTADGAEVLSQAPRARL